VRNTINQVFFFYIYITQSRKRVYRIIFRREVY